MLRGVLRTIRITLDDDLVKSIDRVAQRLHMSGSAFTRNALRDALTRYSDEQPERKHRHSYERNPVVNKPSHATGDNQVRTALSTFPKGARYETDSGT